jgi:hypothetical protein
MQAERMVFHPRRFRFSDDGRVRVDGEERVAVSGEPVGACNHEEVVFVEIFPSFVVDRTVDAENVGMELVTLAFEDPDALHPFPFDAGVIAVE